MSKLLSCAVALSLVCVSLAHADATADWSAGAIHLKSAGPIAFGPDGVLFVSDPMDAQLYAVATGDKSGSADEVKVNVEGVRAKVAAMLGTKADGVRIADIAANPHSANIYLSVARGSGPESDAILLKVDANGDIAELELDNVKHAKAGVPNAPESKQGRRGNPRMDAVTDLAYVDGHVYIAGLSNEEFASKLRSIPFPFKTLGDGTSVEIYHGAHGKYETRSPVRTFAAYEIEGQSHLLAAYTCTPLVKFPVSELKPGAKLRGTTIAELGNRNRPLDMFVYTKDGKEFILIANSSRGVMKVSTEKIPNIEGITERVEGGNTAGLNYETIEDLKGVMQLDRLNADHAIALVESGSGQHLQTIALP